MENIVSALVYKVPCNFAYVLMCGDVSVISEYEEEQILEFERENLALSKKYGGSHVVYEVVDFEKIETISPDVGDKLFTECFWVKAHLMK